MSRINLARACALLVLCGAAAPAVAQWTAKGDAGASIATGNSENQAANANLDLR